MEQIINKLSSSTDDRGNEIVCEGDFSCKSVSLLFTGQRNRLVVRSGAKIDFLNIAFDCDNGYFEIGANRRTGFKAHVRIGQDCRVILGSDVSATNVCTFTAAEGASIIFGDDVMLASEVDIRTDDAHPIFDVRSGQRVNMPKDIVVGNHVWIAKRAVLMGGAVIGDGSVVGFGSFVKKTYPNNCIIAGTPARVVRRDIAWERPHLSLTKPFYKPDAAAIKKSAYWNLTLEST